MTLLHPWWLAAYVVALALWWLAPRAALDRPVAAPFLWRQVARSRAHRPHLAWRPAGVRIPLVLLCLVFALAGPRPQASSPSVAEHVPPPLVGGAQGEGRSGGSRAPGTAPVQVATPATPTTTLPRGGRELATGVSCDGPIPEPLQQFLEEIGAPCTAGSPWRLRVEPGADPAPCTLLWDLGDPLLAGAPGVAGQARQIERLATGPRDRVLARAAGLPAIVLRPAAEGEELVIGADLSDPGLRDDPTLPLLLANWVSSVMAARTPAARRSPFEASPAAVWRWAVAGALAVLWLPLPRHRRWYLAATAPLVVALLVPTLSCGRGRGQRTLLLDVSESVRQAGTAPLLAAAHQALQGVGTVGVVAVAERPEVWAPFGTSSATAEERLRALLARPLPPSHRTALNDGLAVAQDVAGGGDVVVIGDGRGTPPTAIPTGRVVHAILVQPSATRPAATALHVAPQGAGTVVAVVQFHGSPGRAFLITWRVGRQTYTQAAATGPDGWGEARQVVETDGGTQRIEARLDGGRPIAALAPPRGPPVVLLVGAAMPARTPEGIVLEPAVADRLVRRLATEPIPAAVVLADAPAATLGQALLEELARRVRDDGLGLLMTGTPAGIAGGGYHASPLEPTLPLLLDRPPGRAPVAVAVVLDRSGSMVEGAAPTLDLGVAAVLALRRGVDPGDRWSLSAFDVAIHTLDPLGPPPAEADLGRRLATLHGGGGTDPWLAIRRAAEVLATAPEASRHLVLVTDGHLPPAPPGWQGDALPGADIILDLVQVGSAPPSPAAVAVATATGGTVHTIPDAAALPRAIAVAGRGDHGPFRAGEIPYRSTKAVAPFPVPGGTIDGYCPAQPAPDGAVVLNVADGAPLLALGRHGLGRTGIWTGRSETLLARPELWQPLLTWLAPAPSDDLECLLSGATLRVTFRATTKPPLSPGGVRGKGAPETAATETDARPGARTDRPRSNPPPAGEGVAARFCRVERPDGETQVFTLHRIAADLWTGTTDLPVAGRCRVEVARDEGAPAVAARFVLLEPDPEWAVSPAAGKAVLARIARESGGRFVAENQPLPPPPRARERWHPHPPLLLLAGAILLLSPRPAPFRK